MANRRPLLKTDRRRHSYAENRLMAFVAREFTKKKKELGSAKRAAKVLNVSLASFYNYMAGTDLPRADVLRRATVKWGIKWPAGLDPTEIVQIHKVRSVEQLAFSFLDAVREGDIEIVEVAPVGQNMLQVKLRIHFQTLRVKA